ncbi:heat shock factor protein 2 [Gadus macrocephalus]|uniref:heat shock factor protein 2 n=1 Tax=Gadus macrocephalus TaxID=80720 RepID=UPI0028CB1E86|nr:heat shock factor protein 2 [Gadus macrocephalus]
MKNNATVPAFLTKLWTLVEDEDSDGLIRWSQEGNSFLVLDEQRFAKETLPRFFKHNNMASFIRQLNMYGFRKVMHIDTGVVKQERDGPVEFQHPYFKHGQDDLLENIKRKVSNTRPEESKIRQEDLSKILASVQNVHGKQETMDSRLSALKRENEALWQEISDLRQKHVHQQQLIKKLIHFIVTLVQNNRIINLKRKRPILMNASGKKPKYIHQIYDDNSPVNSLNEISEDVIICDVTDEEAEGPARVLEQCDGNTTELDFDCCTVLPAETEVSTSSRDELPPPSGVEEEEEEEEEEEGQRCWASSSSALQLNKPSPSLSMEDPMKMMDSILKESGAVSQNINLLGKLELMDYLDSIDCSLEDFTAMFYGKHFSIDPDPLEETATVKEPPEELNRGKDGLSSTTHQLIQYTSSPLLAFLDGCGPSSELELGGGFQSSLTSVQAEPPTDILEASPTPSPPSATVRLEPLTEAEASQTSLFYLCELPPASPLLDAV